MQGIPNTAKRTVHTLVFGIWLALAPHWWRRWWRKQPPPQQDRLAVMLFLAAIASAFWYLQSEELERGRETLKRDLEYAEQQLRLGLLERQEQLARLAHEITSKRIKTSELASRVDSLFVRYPDLEHVLLLDEQAQVRSFHGSPRLGDASPKKALSLLKSATMDNGFWMAQYQQRPGFSHPIFDEDGNAALHLYLPLSDPGRYSGMVIGEYSLDGLLRHGVPADIAAKYAVALINDAGIKLAGTVAWVGRGNRMRSAAAIDRKISVTPVGSSLLIHAQAYRTSIGLVGNGLFWLVCALSVLTAWMLIGTWRHTRQRAWVQAALLKETHFRRAMENSMLTGMRALDLQGRITYVNPAFCKMTGWTESELLGRVAPFPYWPEADAGQIARSTESNWPNETTASGFQVKLQRKDGTSFEARIYVSPLVDPMGRQTGWIMSMTDVTEPNRIRQQLSESHERFTTVLEAMDASISVAPLDGGELLFANRLYRLWFGTSAAGHSQLAKQAGTPLAPTGEVMDHVDSMAGMPMSTLTGAETCSADVFVPALDKWLEVRSRYLSWIDGRLTQMLIASDITPRRRAEELAAAQAERAQSVSRLITMGEMASSMAHELNQPLTAINNYCNGLITRIKGRQLTNQDLLAVLAKTSHQAQRAGQVIERIRSFVKRSESKRVPSSVVGMVMEAMELADIELRRHQVRLSVHVAENLPSILVDPILIEQVLVNLLKNAAESIAHAQRESHQRSVDVHVALAWNGTEETVEFSVSDSGKGLSPEGVKRLYEAFFSTKSEGMGIGLNLCRSIVESHHGRMQAQNLYNSEQTIVGCRFSFWLPVSSASSTIAPPPPASLFETPTRFDAGT